MKFSKVQIIILVILAAILVIAGIIYWNFNPQKEASPNIATPGEEKQEGSTLSAIVLNIDEENKILAVRPAAGGDEIKVILSENTKLEKLTLPPFDPKNPPKGSITPERIGIAISDFKAGDNIFIQTNKDTSGEKEVDNVNFVAILP